MISHFPARRGGALNGFSRMDLKEFSGENVEAATEKAEAHFGLPRADLRIKVVADEKSGLYRVGLEKRAVIVARQRV
ncbi:MAG: Jag N-terminal domain-containing protein, partial [Myxococcota bacterium]